MRIDDLPARIADKIIPEPMSGCWLWVGGIDGRGYGAVWLNGKVRKAHRVVFEAAYGPVGTGLEFDHLCRNTACVNPMHLDPVTHLENVRRGAAKKAACPNGHRYDIVTGGSRRCRRCRKAYMDVYNKALWARTKAAVRA